MKKILTVAALTLCISTAAQATLLQGHFSGLVDVNGSTTAVVDGASFSGSFLYDDETLTLLGLSATLFGVDDIYSYTYDYTEYNYLVTGNTYGDPNILDFDGLPGQQNFIDDEDLNWGQLSLNFDENGEFIPGTSYSGSVLYFWTTTQFNSNITSMTMSPYAVPVPEPSTMVLFSGGLAGLIGSCRRKKK